MVTYLPYKLQSTYMQIGIYNNTHILYHSQFKIELVSGTGVTINASKKKIILFQIQSSGDPSLLMRLLIENYFKDEDLVNATATNKGSDKHRVLNQQIVSAIQTFVMRYAEHMKKQITKVQLNKILANKICAVRRKMGRPIKKPET